VLQDFPLFFEVGLVYVEKVQFLLECLGVNKHMKGMVEYLPSKSKSLSSSPSTKKIIKIKNFKKI
jgi:hypothetical protein